MNGIKGKAQKRVEQDVDLVLKKFKLEIPGQSHDEVLMPTDKSTSTKKRTRIPGHVMSAMH